MARVEQLKPGEFLWMPQLAPEGPLLLMVNILTQRAVLYRNGVPIGISTVSTGRSGHETPTGVFTILEKDEVHHSSIYENAPMPFMQRLTWGGVALHAGKLPGYPASHGCVRLPLEFAKLLFSLTKIGMTVVVAQRESLPPLASTPGLPATTGSNSDPAPYDWHPDRAPAGPVTILVSGSDHRMVVIRQGRIIGSARVEIDFPLTNTEVYQLRSIEGKELRWTHFSLMGAHAESDAALELQKFRVAEPLTIAIASVLVPGTTVIITADSLQPADLDETNASPD